MLKGLLMRRQSSQASNSGVSSQSALPLEDDGAAPEPAPVDNGVYGDSAQDAGDEVRFSVELTRLDRLHDTYSLDIRRLKGNLRSYKFLYDTLRECVVVFRFVIHPALTFLSTDAPIYSDRSLDGWIDPPATSSFTLLHIISPKVSASHGSF